MTSQTTTKLSARAEELEKRRGQRVKVTSGNFEGTRGVIAGVSCYYPLVWCIHPDDKTRNALLIHDHSLTPLMGLIPHNYVSASDDPGAYSADGVNRQAVTVDFAYHNLVDEPLYMFVDGDLAHWVEITGMDRFTDAADTYVIEYGQIGELAVPDDFRLYVSRGVLHKLGLPDHVEKVPGAAPVPAPKGKKVRTDLSRNDLESKARDLVLEALDAFARDSGLPDLGGAGWQDADLKAFFKVVDDQVGKLIERSGVYIKE